MNLLFVLPAYEPAWAFGGIVRSTSSLCRALAALGHRVTVYTTNADGKGGTLNFPLGEPVDLGGVETYFFPGTFGPKSVWDSRALMGRLRHTAGSFDLVYLSAVWQWIGVATASVCARWGVPLVMGTRGSLDRILWDRGHWKKTLFWHLFLRRALSRAAALHLTSAYERRESEARLGRFDSFIVPNGLDCDYFAPVKGARARFRQRYGIPAEAPLVVTVGRIDPKKRVDLLIRAVWRNPDLYLAVVGGAAGELAQSWKNLARELGAASRVIWTGHLEGRELVEAYGAADVFSLISRDENFGMVAVEALACGLPILVTTGVGVWEEVSAEEVGRAVDFDLEAVVQALEHFRINRSLWAGWGKNGPKVARDKFTPARVASLMAQAFRDVVSGKRSRECRWSSN
jgi:glycosyltransferase involved in cell wall biosynthesis